ncbi:hypothetical protein K0G11_18450, partial [Phocaeicola vulgatus]|nr:hypothetical protein [Phocaeicola vulgatus]
ISQLLFRLTRKPPWADMYWWFPFILSGRFLWNNLGFSLLYVQRRVKLTNISNDASTDIKAQSIDISIE